MVRRNIAANFAASAWSALMALAFLPLYIRFLGIEAFGLIGIYAALAAILALLDMGLSLALNRELARLSASPGAEQQARDLTRTFEAIYWLIGILLGSAVALLAPVLAHRWLNVHGLAVELVERSAIIMGVALAAQWPTALYAGGLMGLQRQVLLSAIRAVAATIQGGGAALVLWLVSPTIVAYFLWQATAAAAVTAVMAYCLWESLPRSAASAAFDIRLLASQRRFAGGMFATSVLVAVLTQADKAVLSRMLSLEMFGYYSLAASVAATVSAIAYPIVSALFPRLSQVASRGTETEAAVLYHKGSQLMMALVAPVWITIVLFSPQLLALWTRDAALAANAHLLVALLVTGSALNCIAAVPYWLQLAYGWTSLMLYVNAVSAVLFVPLLIWLVAAHGAAGAAVAWIALNAAYVLFVQPLMHRRLLRGELRHWYLVDVALPLAAGLGAGFSARSLMPASLSDVELLLWIAAAFAFSSIAVTLTMPHTRAWLTRKALSQA